MKAIKEYIRSFRIIASSQLMMAVIRGGIGGAVGIGICFLIDAYALQGVNKDFHEGFLAGFSPAISALVPALGVVLMNGIFDSTNPSAHGYKYFHSLIDGAEHFRRAVAVGNIIALTSCIVWALAVIPLSFLLQNPMLPFFTPVIGLFILGLINFVGYSSKMWVRIAGMSGACVFAGFVTGFVDGMTEDGKQLDALFFVIAIIVCVAFYVSSAVYVLINAKKKWYAEEKPDNNAKEAA